MILHLKNKHQLALRSMIKQCLDQQGIPDYVELDQFEAYELLQEMQSERENKEYKKKFRIHTRKAEIPNPSFVIYKCKPITEDVGRKLITDWVNGEFTIEYHYRERDNKASTATNTVFQEATVEIQIVVRRPPTTQQPPAEQVPETGEKE